VYLGGHDFVIKAVYSSNMFVREHRQGEVDQEDECNRGMEEISQERGFETANGSVDDDCREHN
jgi:hypothetical protein